MERGGSSEDPAPPVRERLAEEAKQQVERMSAELRKSKVPIETEPPTAYRP